MDIRARRNERGFTIIELMITVAILGVLAAVAIPSFQNYQWKSRRSEAYVNLAALARTQKAYFGLGGTFYGVAPAEPGMTLGNVPTITPRDSEGIEIAFRPIGFASEGHVYFDYDSNVPDLGLGCNCIQCFTATAYGDIDGRDGLSAMMYVHPDTEGNVCPSAMFGYTTPVDETAQPIYDQVAINRALDDY